MIKKFLILGILIGLCSCASNKKSEEIRSDRVKIYCQDTVLVCFQFSEVVKSLDCVYDPLLVDKHCKGKEQQ